MTKKQVQKRISQLKKEINYHRHLYHVEDQQEISDSALDSLKHELKKLEDQFPEFITPDSPTQRVGGEPLKKFKKIKHQQPVLSMEDVFDFKELKDWENYMQDYLFRQVALEKVKAGLAQGYYGERKIDGVDIVLTYQKGILKTGATRGNGKIGEEVTQNIKTIEAIPLKLQLPIDMVVRGEIFMSKKDFIQLNKKREKQGLPFYANPRNVAAGSVRQLNPQITAQRKLDCYIFDIITDLGLKTHQQVHKKLKELGFKTDTQTRLCADLEEIKKYYQSLLKKRAQSTFDYDGVVVVLNNIALAKILGSVGKSPRWMRAYKFPGEQATTIIEDIIIQIGRTGALTPVAKLKPVSLMGSTVSRATLHNQDEIDRLDVRIGDTVIIEKAGDIIPAVIRVLKNLRKGTEKKFKIPLKCPFCQGKVKRMAGGVAYYCASKNCFAQQKQKIKHFVSKKCFDIEGLGGKIVSHLMDQGLIKDAADLFTLKKGDLEPLERFASKSADNLIKAINQSRKITWPRFIESLGIRHIGEQTAFDLAEHYPDLESLSQASLTDLEALSDLGPVMSQSVFNWFREKKNQAFLKKLKKAGIEIEKEGKPKSKTFLNNKKIVFTGTLKSLTREQAEEKVRARGGRTFNQVNKKIDYLVEGDNPGSKKEQAKKLGIKIINEPEFLKMLKK
jgi:DNA ligase (NAD+)